MFLAFLGILYFIFYRNKRQNSEESTMSEEKISLPPLITDSIQGKLVLIILRPTLLPSPNPSHSLEFRYNWWGSNILHKARLTPDHDELRIVYDIRSDMKGLQRYLTDAENLNVDIFVVSSENFSDSPLKCQVRRKTEWKAGDYVGKFSVTNLKLNARGEYVNECNIINGHGDHLGSVVVFFLFASEISDISSIKSSAHEGKQEWPEREEQGQHVKITPTKTKITLTPTKNKRTLAPTKNKKILTPTKSKKTLTLTKNMKTLTPTKNKIALTPTKNKITLIPTMNQITLTPPKDKIALRENLSPRFIVFDNSTKNIKSPPKKCLKIPSKSKEYKITSNLDRETWQNRSLDVAIPEPKIMSPICGNENYIITKLFSFVDSGAIHPSDLPKFIQIYQGRSPSIDLDTYDFQDKTTISLNNPMINRKEEIRCVDNNNLLMDKVITPTRTTTRNEKKVNFSGVSYCSSSYTKQISNHNLPKETNRIFNEEFLLSLSLKDQNKRLIEAASSPVKSFPIIKNINEQEKTNEKTEVEMLSINVKEEDSSLLVLRFYSIHFNYNFNEAKKEANSIGNQNKKITVRQRSKICYFVEAYLEFEKKEGCQNALYVSRQITENQEITFNTAQIFRLPNLEDEYDEGCLKFRVTRRRLGNRLRESVGVGIISLDKLRSEVEGEKFVMLPLWAASDSSDKLKFTNSNSGKMELPLGSFRFSVTFAMSNTINSINDQSAITPHHGIGNSYRLQWNEDKEEFKPEIDIPESHEGKDVLNETFTTESGLPSSEMNLNTQESLIIENRSDVKYIPVKNSENYLLPQEVHLEILEGNGLPSLRSKSMEQTFPPNSYVLTSVSTDIIKTNIVKCSATPLWNYRKSFVLHRENLEHTNYSLILKVFHSLDGHTTCPNDPFLGFAPIDTNFLWTSFLSLCGWVPLLNLDGELCGEIKVSLTPKRSRSSSDTNIKEFHYSENTASPDQSQNLALKKEVKIRLKEEKLLPAIEERLKVTTDCRKDLFNVNKDNRSDTYFSRSVHHHVNNPDRIPTETIEENYIGMCGDKKSHKLDETSLNKYSSIKYANIMPAKVTDKNIMEQCITDPSPQRTLVQRELNLKPIPKEIHIPTISNPVIESMKWMNQGVLDSPCVSYLDLGSKFLDEGNVKKVQPTKRRSRIAAT